MWYWAAAAQGDLNAQFDLGGMYARGEGMPPTPVEAWAWLEVAARAGHPGAAAERDRVHATLDAEGREQARLLAGGEAFEGLLGLGCKLAAASLLDAVVSSDCVKPSGKGGVAAELPDPSREAEHGVRKNILRVSFVPAHAQTEAVELGLNRGEELGERSVITFACALEQLVA